ncbi:low temperature requirement protein A [Isoptericola sp. S6320L]|uniref:low temperature requirement protein A n=1 Tax=Isoptericola sp. S6320L TaxID=2926411 RepID=UPI001FF6290D|nr:low temperature requirement protein A [Isoptericola sp. S6320L]MCK0116340.1 low temperature requirement protein A [Isoptericola sp. S6320L]
MSHDRLRRMFGRDPAQTHRAATPLELLFDLVFVVAFAVAGEQAAHLIAEGHVPAGVIGFAFAVFAIVWAWINFTWFASAFDTDDWLYRLTTMVQMIGVVVLALGLPEMFRSIDGGQQVDNEVMVAGYVVMRLAMLAQWLRVARQSPTYRPVALVYATALVVAQLGWVLLAVLPVSVGQFFLLGAGMVLVETAGPVLGERRPVADASGRRGTPWHPHHVAERYGLLIIITLGEGVIGTVASLSAVVEHSGWSVDAVLVCVAGVALTFGLWWTYFLTPAGDLLARHRGRSFGWGYGHLVVFGSLAAVGAGLHVVAYWLEGEAHLSDVGALLAVAVPVLVFLVTDVVLHVYLVGRADPVRLLLLGAAVALLAAAVAVVAAGGTTPVALLLVMLAPAVTVVVHETGGHRRLTTLLDADAAATGEDAPAAPTGGDQAGTLDR